MEVLLKLHEYFLMEHIGWLKKFHVQQTNPPTNNSSSLVLLHNKLLLLLSSYLNPLDLILEIEVNNHLLPAASH